MTKENVVFDTSAARYDLAIKEVEERVKLGWSVKASFMLGGGYLRVDYVRADPNRYKDVGKAKDSVEVESKSLVYGVIGSVGCEDAVEEVATEGVVTEVKETPVKEVVKPIRKTTAKKSEVKDA